MLGSTELNVYALAPLARRQWRSVPSALQLLLAELGSQQLDPSAFDRQDLLDERLVWALTRRLRERRVTPLTRFAGMLCELLNEDTVGAATFDLLRYAAIYSGLLAYPGGLEITRSFEAMATFLACRDVLSLPQAATIWAQPFYEHDVIRPQVLAALDNLVKVGAEISVYRDATSRVSKLAALARATAALDELDGYVGAEVMAPERAILRRIIRQWRLLVSEAGGQVGRIEITGPVPNPYVLAVPVQGDLFMGREGVLRRLEELWAGSGQKPSVVLYGHRRMGKSSILHNLGARFGTQVTVVDFNMQRVGLVHSAAELLFNLALALYESLDVPRREQLGEPQEERFIAHNPYTASDSFVKRLNGVRDGRQFIVAVDEFEAIEERIHRGLLEPELLEFFRGLIQTYPWFVMAFAGLHTLREMTEDYWHPLYASVTAIPVSFLSRDAAKKLITEPSLDFSIDYDAEAVGQIIALTNGQPYLIQLIGHALVTRFNRQAYEEGIERERRFALADVEAVIAMPELYRDGDAYFTGVWVQAETTKPAGQTTVLRALAQCRVGMGIEDLARQTALAPEEVQSALDTLKRHDVVMEKDGQWRCAVELMRRWVAQQKG